MAATRVFVRGLPPTIIEDDFRNHFANRYAVTDVKLFAHRRIGYVGFKTAKDAAAAVKYFNRSYLRMSRIGVELADAVSFHLSPITQLSLHLFPIDTTHRAHAAAQSIDVWRFHATTMTC